MENQQILSTQFGITVFVYSFAWAVKNLVLCKHCQHENSRHLVFIVFSFIFSLTTRTFWLLLLSKFFRYTECQLLSLKFFDNPWNNVFLSSGSRGGEWQGQRPGTPETRQGVFVPLKSLDKNCYYKRSVMILQTLWNQNSSLCILFRPLDNCRHDRRNNC